MTDQNTFMEVLREVKEIVRTSEVPMSENEIMSYFSDMDLSAEQKRLIIDYLNAAEEENAGISDEDSNLDGEGNIDEGDVGAKNGGSLEESKILKAYMEDLSLLEDYSEEEMMALYKRLFSGENEVIETISTVWLRKVLDIAKKYMDLHAKVEDLIQEGNIALLMRLNQLCGTPDCSDAEKNYDEIEAGLTKAVERGILDYISEWNSAKEQESTLVGKLSLVHEAENYLKEENGVVPTVKELAAFTKMSEKELTGLMELMKKK